MSKPGSPQFIPSTPAGDRASGPMRAFSSLTRPVRAAARTTVFFLKLFPMLPSRPVDWVTPNPVVERVRYPTCTGMAEGDVYRPQGPGPFPGLVVCLGVVPFTTDHPQVPVMGKALARAGIAALLYWSPSMRDFRLDPADLENLPLAYDWLIRQPYIDPARSGLLGTCVGGSFALMAAAHPQVRERVAFASAYAPFSSMLNLAPDVASSSCDNGEGRLPWKVDQLTRRVFVHSLTAWLDPAEAERLRAAFAVAGSPLDDGQDLSEAGRAIYALLTAGDVDATRAALQRLPADLLARLNMMSPLTHLDGLRAPLIVLLHDRGDQVIPVGESRRLVAALQGRPGVRFTEMQFSHLDPAKGKLPFFKLLREFGKFIAAVYPIFWQAAAG